MDTFGRLPTDVIMLIKDLHQMPQFHIEIVEGATLDDYLKVFLVLKVNQTLTKFLLFEEYEHYNRTRIRLVDISTDKLRDIFKIMQSVIDGLENNKNFYIKCGIEFVLCHDYIRLIVDGCETILINNEDCRNNLIDGLYQCYDYIQYNYHYN